MNEAGSHRQESMTADHKEPEPESAAAAEPESAAEPKTLTDRLPNELWRLVCRNLTNRDIKNLRLTCRRFGTIALLRIKRIFLSPNPLNIDVFLSIANHDDYRKDVVELIYDDAPLIRTDYEARNFDELSIYQPRGWKPNLAIYGIAWFCMVRRFQARYLRALLDNPYFAVQRTTTQRRYQRHIQDYLAAEEAAPDVYDIIPPGYIIRPGLTVREVVDWDMYQELLAQQGSIAASNAHLGALQWGLQRFPNLRKVTVTPIAHGFPLRPLHPTPMIRAFPPLFNYPLPRIWPQLRYLDAQSPLWSLFPLLRDGLSFTQPLSPGFCAVMKALAEKSSPPHATELTIEGHTFMAGIDVNLFARHSQDYDNFAMVLSRPGFRRLRLSISFCFDIFCAWNTLGDGLLRDALARASTLESISLETDFDRINNWERYGGNGPPPVSLSLIFPPWTNLQHFRLWNFTLQTADLIRFLSGMPRSLLSAELGDLSLVGQHRTHYELLEQLRQHLTWQYWERRPNLRIGLSRRNAEGDVGIVHMLETEVDDFLYFEGRNPFWLPAGMVEPDILLPMGVLRNLFDPEYEVSWAYFAPVDIAGNWCVSDYKRDTTTSSQ